MVARRGRPWWRDTVVVLVVAVGLAVLVKTFVVQAFYIPSGSMEPGLLRDDRILVEQVSGWGDPDVPERGDVVVFEDPGGWLPPEQDLRGLPSWLARIGLYPEGGHLVKRVIGLPGDTVTCCDAQGRIAVNGVAIREKAYVEPQRRCSGPMPPQPLRCDWTAGPVPAGSLFVMGDNRDDSGDSSAHLCIPGDRECDPGGMWVPVAAVVGRVVALMWPPGRAGRVGRVEAFADVPAPSALGIR